MGDMDWDMDDDYDMDWDMDYDYEWDMEDDYDMNWEWDMDYDYDQTMDYDYEWDMDYDYEWDMDYDFDDYFTEDYEEEMILNGKMQSDCSALAQDCIAGAEFVDNQMVSCRVHLTMAGMAMEEDCEPALAQMGYSLEDVAAEAVWTPYEEPRQARRGSRRH